MKSVLLEELNSSYNNKLVTIQGIVKEISPEFEDDNYGFIQSVIVQSLKKRNQQIGVQRDVTAIFLEDHIGLISLGDKVQITGVQEVYNAHDSRIRDSVLVAKNTEIINDEVYINLTWVNGSKPHNPTIYTFWINRAWCNYYWNDKN